MFPKIAFCLLLASGLAGQTVAWTRSLGVSGYAYGNRIGAGEGIYTAGAIRNGEALPFQTSAGAQDAFLRRYDVDGSIRFTRQFGTAANDEARGVVYHDQYIYVAGYVEAALPGQSHYGSADAFLRKYDGYGNIVWTRQFGTALREEAFFVAAAGSTVYVAGGTKGVMTASASNPNAATQAFVAAFHINGTALWSQQIAHAFLMDTNPVGLAADQNGVFLASNGVNNQGFVDRLSPMGALQGVHSLSGPVFPGPIHAIALDSSGYYVAGPVGGDVLTAKVDRTNMLLPAVRWTRQLGVAAQAFDLIAASGAVYLTGEISVRFPALRAPAAPTCSPFALTPPRARRGGRASLAVRGTIAPRASATRTATCTSRARRGRLPAAPRMTRLRSS